MRVFESEVFLDQVKLLVEFVEFYEIGLELVVPDLFQLLFGRKLFGLFLFLFGQFCLFLQSFLLLVLLKETHLLLIQ